MKTITIRGIDEETALNLKKKSHENKKSMNQFIIDIIRQALHMDKSKKFTKEYNDLDNIFGIWSQQDFDRIQGEINADRKIDPDLWQ